MKTALSLREPKSMNELNEGELGCLRILLKGGFWKISQVASKLNYQDNTTAKWLSFLANYSAAGTIPYLIRDRRTPGKRTQEYWVAGTVKKEKKVSCPNCGIDSFYSRRLYAGRNCDKCGQIY